MEPKETLKCGDKQGKKEEEESANETEQVTTGGRRNSVEPK